MLWFSLFDQLFEPNYIFYLKLAIIVLYVAGFEAITYHTLQGIPCFLLSVI